MAQSIKEIIEQAEAVEPIAEKDGVAIVSFPDAAAKANMEHLEPSAKTGLRTYNNDGSLARIRYEVAAINPANYFANRFKATKTILRVVIDWRAITEQPLGKIYTSHVTAYVFKRDEEKKLYLDGVELVSDADFISDYTNTLNEEAMKEIAPMLANFGTNITESSIPI